MSFDIFKIEELPSDPAEEFKFLLKQGLVAFHARDRYICEACGWHGGRAELATQTDYAVDDAKIKQLESYVCPCCKYPGITHYLKTVTIERKRIRQLKDPKGRFD